MIVLFVSAKVGHRQTTPLQKSRYPTLGQRLFYVYEVPVVGHPISFC